jgi:hypothetical protein
MPPALVEPSARQKLPPGQAWGGQFRLVDPRINENKNI